jgi:DNA processing protein
MSLKIESVNQLKFPERINQLHEVPKKLCYIGQNIDHILIKPVLGVVGSRKVSRYGKEITTDLVSQACARGITIVSGLALGVDSIAHQAALDSKGLTIAVLPSGIEKIYPSSHTQLARKIVAGGGTLITEYSGKSTPMRHRFIERNRIIAALSDALLITEAAENSGSLHTARFALELGKSVLAVPGNINSPTSAGTNNLIKMGATPVTSIDDVLVELNIETEPNPNEREVFGDNDAETNLLKLISEGRQKGSELHELSKLSAADFQQHLSMLEIKGRIKPLGNDHWDLA